MVKTIEPNRLIEPNDPKSGENLELCWADFLEKDEAKQYYSKIEYILESRKDPVNPSAYIQDELIWIRSGFGYENRQDYLTCERTSRGINFPKFVQNSQKNTREKHFGIPTNIRQQMLLLLEEYEDYMKVGGLLDEDGVSLAAYSLRTQISDFPSLKARCVLVDEVQDLSTLELAVIKEIPTAPVDGIFLCGDQAQKVFPKQQNLTSAEIDIVGRGKILKRNYRNTRQILEAAFPIIEEYINDAAIDKKEMIEPEYAFRNRSKPDLYECTSSEEQIDVVMRYLENLKSKELDSICVCSPCDETLSRFESRAQQESLETVRLSGLSDYQKPGIRVSRLEFVKGHEFSHVFLLDLSDSFLPRQGIPPEEYWRDAFQLYVAMTRARDELIMTYVHNRSILLRNLRDTVFDNDAKELLL